MIKRPSSVTGTGESRGRPPREEGNRNSVMLLDHDQVEIEKEEEVKRGRRTSMEVIKGKVRSLSKTGNPSQSDVRSKGSGVGYNQQQEFFGRRDASLSVEDDGSSFSHGNRYDNVSYENLNGFGGERKVFSESGHGGRGDMRGLHSELGMMNGRGMGREVKCF
jgi:hypothetical protein